MDRYGDDHLMPCDDEDFRALLRQVGDQSKRWESGVKRSAFSELYRDYGSLFSGMPYLLFADFVFELDDSTDNMDGKMLDAEVLECKRRNAEQLIRLYGGVIALRGTRKDVTHVIRLYEDTVREDEPERRDSSHPPIVSYGWLKKAIKLKTTFQF
jgi:predicted Ser/Thr protein kinase